jgi:L-threonylcarbamoyladenylate synthase
MIILDISPSSVKLAASRLISGNLVAFPTETVYGLGADATNEKAVSRIYSVKGRPVGHPLIVHISSINKLEQWATDIPDYAIKLGREFWPGPMTLILPRTDLAKDFITGGQNNVGLRVPAQPIALALLKKFEDLGGQGVAAPSANRFGAVSPTSAEAVGEELGSYLNSEDLVLDGGKCLVGIESTIVDCTGSAPRILRPGAITGEMIKNQVGLCKNIIDLGKKIRVPGIQDSHYSPKATIILNGETNAGDGFIALNCVSTPKNTHRLMSPKNSDQFAHELYEALRKADHLGLNRVIVVPPVGGRLSDAIQDRLTKASIKM